MTCDNSFVLVTCDEKKIDAVYDDIISIPTVKNIYRIQGIYDLLIHISESNDTVKETVQTKIRYVNGVRSTLTLLSYT